MALLLLVPIGLILTGYVAYATSMQSHAWADALVRWMTNFPVLGKALASLVGPLATNGASWIANRLGHVYLGVQGRIVNFIGGVAQYAAMAAKMTLEWPFEMITFARWLVGSEIPHLIRGLPNAVTSLVHQARAIIGSLERDVGRLTAHLPGQVRKWIAAGLIGVIGPFIFPLRWLLAHWRKIAHASVAAGGVAAPWIVLPKLRKDVRSLRREFDKVKGVLGVAVFAATLAKVFQVSTRCVRGGNIGKAAKRWCGLDPSFVDSLLLDFVAVASIASVVEFAKDLRAIEDEAVAVMGKLVREWPS